jgi:Peptidase propeptide and YPEB domain
LSDYWVRVGQNDNVKQDFNMALRYRKLGNKSENDMKMMTKRNTIILMVTAILAVPILLLSGITNVSTYLSDALVINNSQSPSTSASTLSTNTAYSSPNWVGSIQVSNALSQLIQSKVHTTLGNAAAGAEKAVGINSHATSANLGEERGYLVYTVRIMDGNNNSHKVIVDAGNGRVLFTQSIFDQEEHSNNNVVYQYRDHHHDEDNE